MPPGLLAANIGKRMHLLSCPLEFKPFCPVNFSGLIGAPVLNKQLLFVLYEALGLQVPWESDEGHALAFGPECIWPLYLLADENSKKKNTSRPWTYSTICDGEAFTFQWVKITQNLFSLIQCANDLPYAQLMLAAGKNSK